MAGKYRHRLTLQYPTVTKSASGGQIISYTMVMELYALVKPISGREYMQGGHRWSDVTHQIMIRYNKLITAACRFQWDNRNHLRTFNIVHVIDSWERSREMELICKEVIT